MPSADGPMLPGFIIAGVPKSGTTSLFGYLAGHPGLAPSRIKEPKYWTPLRNPDRELGPIEDYHAQWAGTDPDLLRFEATPGYFYGGRRLAEAIRAGCPDVRVLLVLREPASRLLSCLRFIQARQKDGVPADMTFRQYVDTCRAELAEDGRERLAYYGIGAGHYNDLLAEWIDVFGDRLRITFLDDVSRDPRAVLTELCTWLGLDPGPVADLSLEERNRTYTHRNQGLQGLALRARRSAAGTLLRNPVVKKPLATLYRRMNAKPTQREVDPEEKATLAEMRSWYAEHNAGLRDVLSRVEVIGDVPDWVT